MSTPSNGDPAVPLSIDERELLNEWAAEIDAGVEELARRLILRYLHVFPVAERDELDERIGRTLLARRRDAAAAARDPRVDRRCRARARRLVTAPR